MKFLLILLSFSFTSLLANGQSQNQYNEKNMLEIPKTNVEIPEGYEIATLGSGCFWCIEAIYQELNGVDKVKSGYSGGHIASPTYRQVTNGTTGHAEVIQFLFDPKILTFSEILEIFWSTHDPTTLNRQGADVGPQYRSAVFYHSDSQKQEAEFFKKKLDDAGAFNRPIVTEITPFSNFYVAEDYHQNYFKDNGMQPYCQIVVRPKVEKFKKVFAEKLK
ncbi:peptide methionine sulfoxide reductase [Rhodonellum psychrophilum GCM71 = DSM 17998]|uniref:Peptide methionine sulfoxide reductase MsrA n=2 Tax=Rhodonellum TaxID=336827 RepID=U5C092_9BACT|nr:MULTISPECIES: peptide-methionine (S)-S-oxide reductase MsrA [Rhodonellum]ERM81592.1 peptide methionine sulfoxide reductase [Rhodonellum psychrophilum GCM71 = DSM 17998]SDZ37027.1 peptide-methionine (S)-S-oxide reductase [Rhodonellum ikkaensis]